MELITKSVLRAKRACSIQVAIFAKEWPNGVTPSLEACHRAAAIGLNLYWFAVNMLNDTAWAAYEAACATAWAAYEAACAEALWNALQL